MEDRKLTEIYNSSIIGEETIDGRETWVLKLTAKREGLAYESRKLWIDTERYIPLKEELYAKSGKLLKQSKMSDIEQTDGRWFPKTVFYKDMLKQNSGGTEFKITYIQFNIDIPDYLFSKAALKQ
jgi:negative regulator of sigma E activity